jgi:hypothetical protein
MAHLRDGAQRDAQADARTHRREAELPVEAAWRSLPVFGVSC